MKKVVENFKCEVCGAEVKGDGTTDHCPKCLWGKHVDEEIPGDRASMCKGLMKPIRSEYRNGQFRIYYKCQSCNHDFWVREGEGDNREILVELTKY
jgi:DNA-directed RNA polymerase subunit RPC12/RpoP